VLRVFLRTELAQLRASWSLVALCIVGVALGVASVTSIRLLNTSAVGAFQASVDAVSGDCELSITGAEATFDDAAWALALDDVDVAGARPHLRVIAIATRGDERVPLELFGVDFAAVGSGALDAGDVVGPALELGQPLSTPGFVALSAPLAERLGLRRGDAFDVRSGSRTLRLRLGLVFDFSRKSPLLSPRTAFADLAQVQAMFGLDGRVSRIDVKLRAGADADVARARLAARMPVGVEVRTTAEQRARADGLLEAFRVNLTALSFVAVFAGLFLVTSATQAMLSRRRREFGVLRSFGATRAQIVALIVGEATAFAAIGIAIGLPLGFALARGNLGAISATMTNLYLLEEITAVHATWTLWPLAGLVGFGGAWLGAAWPAIDVARRDPRTLLAAWQAHEEVARHAGRSTVLGFAVLLVGGSTYALVAEHWRPAGFLLGLTVLVAAALVAPGVVVLAGRSVRGTTFGFGFGVKSLRARLLTASFAVAALSIAVSMMLGITLMVSSFRRTVASWIETTISADVYVAGMGHRTGLESGGIDDAALTRIRTTAGVRAVDRLRDTLVWQDGERIRVRGVDIALEGGEHRFPLFADRAGGDAKAAFAAVKAGGVLLGEPLARTLRLGVGDTFTLTTARGAFRFPIEGVFYDYTSEFGAAVLDLETYARVFGPGPPTDLSIYLVPGSDAERATEAFQTEFAAVGLVFASSAAVRAAGMRIFDQTFVITGVLQGMSLLVAVAGVTLALLVMARERRAEIALLRSLGATRAQLFVVWVGKGVALALLGLVPGAIGGLALAWVLVVAINRAYFGWTIPIEAPGLDVFAQVATVLAAAVAAAIVPALRASRAPATELCREDV
jgi:putative ABC transport system permease protein